MSRSVRLAVINLNPFAFVNVVTVEVRPLRTDAPFDFLHRYAVDSTRRNALVRADSVARLLPPCTIPEDVRARLRQIALQVGEARRAVTLWTRDSLSRPREAVADRRSELLGILHDQQRAAVELYAAAWKFRELVRTYAPAVRASGLLDSVRIVPLAVVAKPFEEEVRAIGDCSDDELAMWKTEVQLTNGALADARRELATNVAFLRALEAEQTEYWTIASNPRNFYDDRPVGPYPQPMNVFVYLFRLSRGSTVDRALLTPDRAYAGWTLIFDRTAPQ